MLPQGIYPISKIEQEYAADTQVTKLVSLLGYLLSLINPNVAPKDGKNVGFGERVNANRRLFTNVPDIFFAIGVRNCIVHPESCEKPYTEAEIERAAKHLRNAIYELRDHYRIPADVKRDVFQPTAPRAAALHYQTLPSPNFPHIKRAKPLNVRPKPNSVASRLARWLLLLRPRRPGRWVAALVVGALLSVYGKTIWQLGREKFFGTLSYATTHRKEADAAIKRMQQLDKRLGFAAKVAEAQAAWRKAEIAFHQQRFKDAEQGYQRVAQIWDELVVRQKDPNKSKRKYEEATGLAPSSTPTPEGSIATTTPYLKPPPAPSDSPPTTERPPLRRRERPPEDPPPSNESEDDDIFLIYQKEFMRYVKKQVTPSLPPEAKAQGVSGPVKVEVVLSKNGYLAKARVIEGHPLIRQAALDALRQWRFKPYLLDRVPVDVRSEIAINFRSIQNR